MERREFGLGAWNGNRWQKLELEQKQQEKWKRKKRRLKRIELDSQLDLESTINWMFYPLNSAIVSSWMHLNSSMRR